MIFVMSIVRPVAFAHFCQRCTVLDDVQFEVVFFQVLWEMLTREIPFKGLEGLQVAWLVVEKNEVKLLIGLDTHLVHQEFCLCDVRRVCFAEVDDSQ